MTPIAAGIIANQLRLLKELGINSPYVFPDWTGDHAKQRTYLKRWTRYRDLAGISKATPYELRHTFVSVTKTLPEGLLKPLVGHSKDMDTFGVYGHEVDGDREATANLVYKRFLDILK
jgi:integrase